MMMPESKIAYNNEFEAGWLYILLTLSLNLSLLSCCDPTLEGLADYYRSHRMPGRKKRRRYIIIEYSI